MINNLLAIYIYGGHNACPNLNWSGAPKVASEYLLTLKETVSG